MAPLNFKASKVQWMDVRGNAFGIQQAKWQGVAVTANGITLAESWTPDSQYNYFIR